MNTLRRATFRLKRDGPVRERRGGIPPYKLLLLFGLLLGLTVAPVHAQSNGEGSIYSRFGLGSLLDFSSSQSDAMGGGAYALRSLNYNPDANPALWSDQVYTRLSGSVEYQTINAEDSRGNTGQLSAGTVQALQFSFPLYEQTLGVGLSFQPFSRSNYKATRSGSVEIGPERESEAPYQISFSGSGGLHKIRGGLGYRIDDRFSIGASADFVFGILESQRRTSFGAGASGLRDVVVSDGVRLSGLSGTLGSHLALANVFADGDAFSIGASATLPAQLTGERFRTLDEDLARDTLSTRDGDVSLPWQGRLGIAYQPNESWTIVADGLYEPWSTFSSSFSGGTSDTEPAPFPIGGKATLTDRWRVSVGAEVVPGGEDNLAGYFGRTAYRLGGYVERMYIRPDGSTNLNEFGTTAGISLPTSLSGTRIDFNTTVGVRGQTASSLVHDTFLGVSLHINFGERWFQRRKLR